MKTKLLLLFIVLGALSNYSQTFQQDVSLGDYVSELNTVQLLDGTNDYIVAGSRWDTTFGDTVFYLSRIEDTTGNVVWTQNYTNTNLVHLKAFDMVRYQGPNMQELIAVTGSVFDPSVGYNLTTIATFNATNGGFNFAKYYNINGNYPNSQGLHIIRTTLDFNGSPRSGFVVGGHVNNAYTVNTTSNSVGFVLRVDDALNQLFTVMVEGDITPNYDYDVVNHIVETNGGYFITGGKTITTTTAPFSQQGVLAKKLNENGIMLWDQSYLLGNNFDNGADTFYDAVTEEIFLLANYSVSHSFGITVLDNLSGTVDYTKSWISVVPFANINGFTLNPTLDTDNLVIHGYIRDYNMMLDDDLGVLTSTSVQNTPFVYEFDKATGNQVTSYTYLVPFTYPTGYTDFYHFFNAQFPLAYYPDMALFSRATLKHFSVGYRLRGTVTTPVDRTIEMINTGINLRNECEREDLVFTHNSISITHFSHTVSTVGVNQVNYTLIAASHNYLIETCDTSTASISDDFIDKLMVYPNPAKEFIYINLSESKIKEYAVFDILGKQVLSKKNQENLENISINSLRKGVYLLKVIDENNAILISKFIKN